MNIENIKENLKTRVSEKRYNHSAYVAEMAVELAKIHGANEIDACASGWLHDISKELDGEHNDLINFERFEIGELLDVPKFEVKQVLLKEFR